MPTDKDNREKKERVMIGFDPDTLARIDEECRRHVRSRPFVIKEAVKFAFANGLDLTSGQARELADFMEGGAK